MNSPRTRAAVYFSAAALAAYILLPSLWAHEPTLRRRTTGLTNTGNDCYANSTFQALAALDSLVAWLNAQPTKTPWMAALLDELVELRQEEATSKHTRSLWPLLRVMESVLQARLSRGQQDAHEMLVRAIDLLGAPAHSNDMDVNPFEGEETNTITCLRCSAEKVNKQPFVVLERQPNEPILEPQVEHVSGYNCSECNSVVTIEKRSQISAFPAILAVHTNRSVYNGESFRNTRETAVPLTLGSYRLQSVVFHTGYHSRGHYTCARRKRNSAGSKRWWLISDDTVKEASDKQVMAKKSEAYLLLFEKQALHLNTDAFQADNESRAGNEVTPGNETEPVPADTSSVNEATNRNVN